MATANHTAQYQSLKGWTPEEKAQIAAGTMDDEVFAERLIELIKLAPAILSLDQVYILEKKIQKDQIRRAAFSLGSMSGASLIDGIENNRNFAVTASGIADEMQDLQEKYHQLADLFGDIHGRILAALATREDMVQVMEEGKFVVSSEGA